LQIILVTNPFGVVDEAELINSMFAHGLKTLHIRKPFSPAREIKLLIKQIDPNYRDRIVLHSNFHLCLLYRLKGIHLPEKVRISNWALTPKLVSLSGRSRHTSTTFHSLPTLTNCKQGYSYVFLSPIYDSISKPGYTGQFSLPELKEALPSVSQKVVALGGVTAERLPQLQSLGFHGAAVLGSVWRSEDPLASYLKLQNKLS